MSPPILDDPSERRRMRRPHATSCSTTASRLRLVAWRTPRAVYWVSNTLMRTLTNRQMLGDRAVPETRGVSARAERPVP